MTLAEGKNLLPRHGRLLPPPWASVWWPCSPALWGELFPRCLALDPMGIMLYAASTLTVAAAPFRSSPATYYNLHACDFYELH